VIERRQEPLKGSRMESRKVDCILLPCPEGLPAAPNVAIDEKVTRTIELMISHNITRIAVVRGQRTIGMIRLEDALQEIGLGMPVR
jgi:CBS domain-containing protein